MSDVLWGAHKLLSLVIQSAWLRSARLLYLQPTPGLNRCSEVRQAALREAFGCLVALGTWDEIDSVGLQVSHHPSAYVSVFCWVFALLLAFLALMRSAFCFPGTPFSFSTPQIRSAVSTIPLFPLSFLIPYATTSPRGCSFPAGIRPRVLYFFSESQSEGPAALSSLLLPATLCPLCISFLHASPLAGAVTQLQPTMHHTFHSYRSSSSPPPFRSAHMIDT